MDRNLTATNDDPWQAQGSRTEPESSHLQSQSQAPSPLPSRRATPTPILITSLESKRTSTPQPFQQSSQLHEKEPEKEQRYQTPEESPVGAGPTPPPKTINVTSIEPSLLEPMVSTRRQTMSSQQAEETAPLRVLDRTRSRSKDASMALRPGVDWIVPVGDAPLVREKTVGERLEPTLATAREQRDQYAFKAKLTGWSLNFAIGLQVLLGALTTGLSAVVTGRQVAILTTVLGGFSTLVASYLARARGSNEPELSITRVKDLEQFIRECEAFRMDYGHLSGNGHDDDLIRIRERFEELLGNANG
ncbi:hypothetical protein CVT24_009623 [Panaeolus cyanescens]|uniref:SMODS and SLOG-associating 2TM effector domain-containing protein n=1 Tax=Panaeolus cyanescens TaxID=181874 RepID=A0A409YA03_9AGAR|nr:hypothetical protein CVT24_009623 [Panaeolus cyanescens]